MTKVINIKNAPSGWETNLDFVYIGRVGKGQSGYFGNPIKLAFGEQRGATIERFKQYFYDRLMNDIEFKDKVELLRGKTLVCFCSPNRCHGDIIVEYLESEPDKRAGTALKADRT